MIVFDLRCGGGHVFEAWFASSEAFAGQQERGLVSCPICADAQVEKALMAPAVSAKSNRGGGVGQGRAHGDMKAELAKLAALQAEVEQNCDYVGRSFASEARLRHAARENDPRHATGQEDASVQADATTVAYVDKPRGIVGEASISEAMELIEEGIAVEPLPFRSRRSADA